MASWNIDIQTLQGSHESGRAKCWTKINGCGGEICSSAWEQLSLGGSHLLQALILAVFCHKD